MDTSTETRSPSELFTAGRCVTCARPVANLFRPKCDHCTEDEAYEAQKRALQAKLDAKREIHTDYITLLGRWRAWTDPEGHYGEGKTEQAAIDDLMAQLIEDEQ